MKSLLLVVSVLFTIQASGQVVNNTSPCDMLIYFYCSDGPFGSSTGCGDLCYKTLCVQGGASGVAFPIPDCHSDCKVFDYVIIEPKDLGCVDCTNTTFNLGINCLYPTTNGGTYGGCSCGSTVNMAVTGSGDINIW